MKINQVIKQTSRFGQLSFHSTTTACEGVQISGSLCRHVQPLKTNKMQLFKSIQMRSLLLLNGAILSVLPLTRERIQATE